MEVVESDERKKASQETDETKGECRPDALNVV